VVTFAGYFMITVSDTSAFTSGLELNADVSFSVIMEAVAAAKRCGERRTGFGMPGSPRTTLDGSLRLSTATKRELDVALGVGGDVACRPRVHDRYFWKFDPRGEGQVSKTGDHDLWWSHMLGQWVRFGRMAAATIHGKATGITILIYGFVIPKLI
jgi:hypothetical protein